MNKEKFIDCLRDPSLLQENEIQELSQLVSRYPYFQGARALLAKVSKERNLKSASLRISSAAVYATDRALLKKYINDHLFILDSRVTSEQTKVKPRSSGTSVKPPAESSDTPRKNTRVPGKRKDRPVEKSIKTKSPLEKKDTLKTETEAKESPRAKPEDELVPLNKPEMNTDEWLEEIYADIEELKKSKARFKEVEKKIEEEEAVNAALEAVTKSLKPKKEDKPKEKVVRQKEEEIESPKEEVQPEKQDIPSAEEDRPQEEAVRLKEEGIKPPKEKVQPKKGQNKRIEEEDKPKPEEVKSQKKEVTPKEEETKPSQEEVAKTTAKKEKVEPEKSVEATPKSGDTKTEPSTAQKKKSSTEQDVEESDSKEKAETTKDKSSPKQAEKEIEKPLSAKPAKKSVKSDSGDGNQLKVVRRRSGKVKSTTYESKDQTDSEADKIIDEFISTSPKISKGDKSKAALEVEKEDLADTSTRFQADIASEYLAEIYVEQDKIDRAISIYEKLSLKFPEKKSYFVARIEELKLK